MATLTVLRDFMRDLELGAFPLDALPDPHIVVDGAGVLLATNARFDRRLLGERRVMQHLAQITESQLEFAAFLDGQRYVFSAAWTACHWRGTAARLVRLHDVTHEREHDEVVERNLRILEEAIDALSGSMLLVDATGHIVAANVRWHVTARENGLAMPDDGMGASYLDVCDRAAANGELEAAQVAAGLRDVLARRALAFDMEYQLQGRDDVVKWFRLTVNALAAHPGALIQHVETTESRRQRQEHVDALAHFKAVFDGALDGIVIYDDAMRVLESNAAAEALVAYERPSANAITLLDLVAPADHDRLRQHHEEVLARGTSRGMLRLRRGTKDEVSVEYAARANIVPGRHVAVVRDMTSARQLEAQLRQSQKMEALGQLTGGIAHDFNNLLTVVLAQSDLLLDDHSLEPDVREGLSQILAASQRGADMVRKLLAFGRREQLLLAPTALDATAHELSGILRRILPETIAVQCITQRDVPAALADATAVQQILLNLATNARDAMRERGGALQLRVHTASGPARPAEAAGGRHVVVSVTDTGCGMDADTLAHLFEPFFTTKGPEEGTGLGMAMVYGLMEQMNGQVTVTSESGIGTTVQLHFPEQPVAGASAPSAAVTPQPAETGSERVLLVEDDEAIRSLTARVLRRGGYDVAEATCGDEAAELLQRVSHGEAPFALVVSDVVMPRGDGYRVLEATRAFAPSSRIVWVTGYAGGGSAVGPVHAPCEAPIILKPWTTNEFLSRVRAVLDGPPNVPLDATVTHDISRTG